MKKSIKLVSVLSLAMSTLVYLTPLASIAAIDMPDESMKIPLMVPETSISTYLPSSASPGQGLAINIILPARPRYQKGAPIVVMVPDGPGPSGLEYTMHAAQVGFAELRFSFPGGGLKKLQSSGIYDNRGLDSQTALKDVLLFASGRKTDYRSRNISQLVNTKLMTENVGAVGWSSGGNVLLVTLGKYSKELQFLNWIAFYESPIGALFDPPNLGSSIDLTINNHYKQGSAATGIPTISFSNLTWDPNTYRNPGIHRKQGEAELPGVVYFDDNRNDKWDESTEFAFNYAMDVGLDKQIYPPEVTSAMDRFAIFPKRLPMVVKHTKLSGYYAIGGALEYKKNKKAVIDPFAPPPAPKDAGPAQAYTFDELEDLSAGEKADYATRDAYFRRMALKPIYGRKPPLRVLQPPPEKNKLYGTFPIRVATPPEAEAYFQERDGSLYIPKVAKEYPNILIGIFGSQIDHQQRQPDHPHIALQYNAWLTNNAHWVRLNPDPLYMGWVSQMNSRNFTDNKPNAQIDSSEIDQHLEPEGMVPDYVFMEATVAELADRSRAKNLKPLEEVLVSYTNGAFVPHVVKPKSGSSSSAQDTEKQEDADADKKAAKEALGEIENQ